MFTEDAAILRPSSSTFPVIRLGLRSLLRGSYIYSRLTGVSHGLDGETSGGEWPVFVLYIDNVS